MSHVTSPDGVVINYERVGEGPPLLLFHGFTMGLGIWQSAGYVDDLKSQFTIIAPDARGHGLSRKPHETSAYSVDHMVDDALAVLDAEGLDRAHLWGYSMGGTVIRRLYERAPGRALSVIIGGSAPMNRSGSQPQDDPQAAALRLGMQAFVDLIDPEGNVLTEEARESFLSNDADALAAFRIAQLTWPKSAPQIACPALIYAGSKDAAHDRARDYGSELPDGRFRTVPGANHAVAFRVTTPVLPWVKEFLSSLRS